MMKQLKRYWPDAVAAIMTLLVSLAFILPVSGQLPTPVTPTPSPSPTPPTPSQEKDYPTSGDWWNPANWAPAIHELGPMGTVAIILLCWFIYQSWRDGKQPTNKDQMEALGKAGNERVKLLKLMVRAANARHQQTLQVLRAIVSLKLWAMNRAPGPMSEIEKQTLDQKVSAIYAQINTPPALDAQLQLDTDTDSQDATL